MGALALALALARGAAAQEHQYVGAGKCKTCHGKALIGDQHTAWRTKDPHHRAFATLQGEASRAIAAQRGLAKPAHEAPECLECHVTAFGAPATQIATQLDPAQGVQGRGAGVVGLVDVSQFDHSGSASVNRVHRFLQASYGCRAGEVIPVGPNDPAGGLEAPGQAFRR